MCLMPKSTWQVVLSITTNRNKSSQSASPQLGSLYIIKAKKILYFILLNSEDVYSSTESARLGVMF